MSDLLQQLQDDESVLLMYLAGELPGEDRAEVERRLSADSALREELHALRETQDLVLGGLRRLDDVTPLPVDEAAAVRGTASAIRQWQARRARQGHFVPSRWRTWAIPSAAAALVLVVLGFAFYEQAGHGRSVATTRSKPAPPAGVPAPPNDGIPTAGNPSPPSTSADEYALLMATDTRHMPLADSSVVEELAGSVGPLSPAGAAAPDRDAGHDDAGSRDDGGYTKPVFDIPLDAGQ